MKPMTVAFTGPRLHKLGATKMKSPVMLQLKEALLNIIEDLILNHNVTTFISGGALGVDQAAFWCVYILQKKYPYIKNIVAVPYAEYGEKVWSEEKRRYVGWTDEQIMWYKKMLERANEVIYVDTLPHYQRDNRTPVGKHSNYKLQIRNEYMVDFADILVAVWDGMKVRGSGTWNCLHYAITRYPEMPIFQLHPKHNFEVVAYNKKASSF